MADTFQILLLQSSLLGIFDGVYLSFIVPICFDITRSSHLANHAAGFHHAFISIPSILGPALAGRLYENFHKYDLAFYIGGCTCLIGAILQALSMIFVHCSSSSKLISKQQQQKNTF
jgi:hypothetical protein